MLALSHLPVPDPIMWTRFAALLLLLLSAFYVPAALDPARYRTVAVMAVAARGAGAAFFLFLQPEAYRMFGYFDLVFLDPPFDADLLTPALSTALPLVAEGGFVYLESGLPLPAPLRCSPTRL